LLAYPTPYFSLFIAFAISMSLKFTEGNEGFPSFDSLMEENSSVVIDVALLVSKIKN
jgi:hypothetical protein